MALTLDNDQFHMLNNLMTIPLVFRDFTNAFMSMGKDRLREEFEKYINFLAMGFGTSLFTMMEVISPESIPLLFKDLIKLLFDLFGIPFTKEDAIRM